MTAFIGLLDSGPLGLITHPRISQEAEDCKEWLKRIVSDGHSVVVPEITYYELRRELRRSELKHGVPSTGLANHAPSDRVLGRGTTSTLSRCPRCRPRCRYDSVRPGTSPERGKESEWRRDCRDCDYQRQASSTLCRRPPLARHSNLSSPCYVWSWGSCRRPCAFRGGVPK